MHAVTVPVASPTGRRARMLRIAAPLAVIAGLFVPGQVHQAKAAMAVSPGFVQNTATKATLTMTGYNAAHETLDGPLTTAGAPTKTVTITGPSGAAQQF